MADSVSYDFARTFIVSSDGDSGLVVSTQWETEKAIDLPTVEVRQGFARNFLALIPPKATIRSFSYTFKAFDGYTPPVKHEYRHSDTVSIYGLWSRPEFVEMVNAIQGPRFTMIILDVKGWKDSTLTTPYEDPSGDGRFLYKIQVPLVAGDNEVFFTPAGGGTPASFSTRFTNEFVGTADRTSRFHGSEKAAACADCHSILTETDSASITNDLCVTCHGGIKAGRNLHGPTEMDECLTCHSKDPQTNAVVLAKGVPGVCSDCHEEKVSLVENAAVPHAVAGECLTCHTPHSSPNAKLLKKDVFSLCTGCHTDYTLNHPVGRHPLRFSVVQETGEEISCASCHDPHGSGNKSLLRVPGGRMMICLQCHQK